MLPRRDEDLEETDQPLEEEHERPRLQPDMRGRVLSRRVHLLTFLSPPSLVYNAQSKSMRAAEEGRRVRDRRQKQENPLAFCAARAVNRAWQAGTMYHSLSHR